MSQKRSRLKSTVRIASFIRQITQNAVLLVTLFAIIVSLLFIVLILNSPELESAVEVSITIAGLSTFFAAVSAFAAMISVVELKQQRESQERPYVLAYFDVEQGNAIDFKIENIGASPAIDVEVIFNPPFVTAKGLDLNTLSFTKQPIRLLAPGKGVRRSVGPGPEILRGETKYRCVVRYLSISGKMYSESSEGDLAYLAGAHVPRKSISEVLGEMGKQLEAISASIGKVESQGAWRVESPKENERRIEEMFADNIASGWQSSN